MNCRQERAAMMAEAIKTGTIKHWLFPTLFFCILLVCFEVVGSVGQRILLAGSVMILTGRVCFFSNFLLCITSSPNGDCLRMQG